MGQFHEEYDVPVVGVEPVSDIQASKIHTTVNEGQYVYLINLAFLSSLCPKC